MGRSFRCVALGACLLSAVAVAETPTRKLVCQERSPCRVIEEVPAGETAEGGKVTVVEVALHEREGDDWKQPAREGACAPWEVWTILRPKAGEPKAARLFGLCNDGYGAAGVGEDTFKVSSNALSWSQLGGSAWRWSSGGTLQLWPLKPVVLTLSNFHAGAGWQDARQFDLRTFTGSLEWSCDAGGKKARSVPLTPAVALPDDFTGGGWKGAALGSCAQRVDASGEGGALVHGAAGKAADSALKVVTSEKALFIEVRDDELVTGSDSWLYDDHVEIWTGGAAPGAYACQSDGKPLHQWGIRLADGKVFPAYGKPESGPRVEVAPDRKAGRYRMKVTFDEAPAGFAVVFSDSDDGKTQERLIATAPVKHGKWRSLGTTYSLDPMEATCSVEDGHLNVGPPARPFQRHHP